MFTTECHAVCGVIGTICKNAKHAAHIAREAAEAQDLEWLVALYFTRRHRVLSVERFGLNLDCPITFDPEKVFAIGRERGASSLVTIRYHPHCGPLQKGKVICLVDKFIHASRQTRVGFLSHMVLHGEDEFFSWVNFGGD